MAQFLQNLKEDIQEWRKEFLTRIALAGRTVFSPYLDQAAEMWDECERRYGAGAGYRVDVSGILQDQFESDAGAIATSQKIENQVISIWGQIIIEPLAHLIHCMAGIRKRAWYNRLESLRVRPRTLIWNCSVF